MRVHHLNCGTMNPVGSREPLVCHVLLVESPRGLVLVDTGFGTRDGIEVRQRLGSSRLALRPVHRDEETVVSQLRGRGIDPREVRDVVLTHLDADHAGGLVDLPWATVHVASAELAAATSPRTLLERQRYLPRVRAHGPRWAEFDLDGGEEWQGFSSAREVADIGPDLLVLPLAGHTRGHTGVAVRSEHGWILHAGDTFYHRGEVGDPDAPPFSLRAMGSFSTHDVRALRENRERLAHVLARPDEETLLVNAHDATLLARARERAVL